MRRNLHASAILGSGGRENVCRRVQPPLVLPHDRRGTCMKPAATAAKRHPRFADHFFPGALLSAGRFSLFGNRRGKPNIKPQATVGFFSTSRKFFSSVRKEFRELAIITPQAKPRFCAAVLSSQQGAICKDLTSPNPMLKTPAAPLHQILLHKF